MKPIAVTGAVLAVSPAPASTGTGGAAIFAPSQLVSTKVRAAHKGVYKGPVKIQVSGVLNTAALATIPCPPTDFILNPTATKSKAEGERPLREGDQVLVSVSPLIPPAVPGQPPTEVPTPMLVTVQSAGQQKVRAS